MRKTAINIETKQSNIFNMFFFFVKDFRTVFGRAGRV